MHRNRLLLGTLLFVLLSAPLILGVKAEAATWVQNYGGAESENAYSLVETSDGGYAIAGTTSNNGNCWLVKTDSAGNMLWNKTYGGASWDYAYSLVETSDGGYAMAGCTHSVSNSIYDDAWLIKTDELGNMEWNKTYGTEDYFDGAYSLVETSDGGYALAGYRSYSSLGGWNAWLVKTDASGNMLWNKTYWDSGFVSDWVRSLVETSDGGYAMAGCKDNGDFWLIKTDSLGNMEWNQIYGGEGEDEAYSLVATCDGGYAIAGTWNNSMFGTGGDCWLVKTNSSGNMEWNMTYGGEGNDVAHSLVATSDGGYAIAGTWDYEDWIYLGIGGGEVHTGAFWLVKTNSSGNMEWNMTYGGGVIDGAFSLVAASDGGYALAGFTRSFGVNGSDDFWLVKTDENGVAPVAPEAAWVILPFLLAATVSVFICKKRLLHKRSQVC